jgi:transposase
LRQAKFNLEEVPLSELGYHFFVGADWGTEMHQICVLDHEGHIIDQRKVQHSATTVMDFIDWLSGIVTTPSSAAIAIEIPHGALVEELLERGFCVFSINPKQLDRFRDRYFPAGTKDDRKDALVLADAVRTDRHCFRIVRMNGPLLIRLRELSRLDDELNFSFQRHVCQLRQQLHRYFHHLLQLSPTADEPWLWSLLELASTPAKAAKLTVGRVSKVLQQHHIRRLNAEQVVGALRGPVFSLAAGTIEAASEHVLLLIPHLRLLYHQRLSVARRIDSMLEELSTPSESKKPSDVELLLSLPGVGRLVTATLFAEATQFLAERDYHGLRAYTGVAPVTRQSGKRTAVLMRYGCNSRLRNAVYHWSRVSMQRDPRSREHYHRLRNKGHSHGRALRGVADRLLALLCAMLKSKTLYDSTRRQRARPTNAVT